MLRLLCILGIQGCTSLDIGRSTLQFPMAKRNEDTEAKIFFPSLKERSFFQVWFGRSIWSSANSSEHSTSNAASVSSIFGTIESSHWEDGPSSPTSHCLRWLSILSLCQCHSHLLGLSTHSPPHWGPSLPPALVKTASCTHACACALNLDAHRHQRKN